MAKTVGVVLSGCGVFDGAEIHESVLTLYFLAKAGARARCLAPDVPQLHVVDHRTRDVAPRETRNVLVESARIARGDIHDLATAKASELDALILPGGSGAAKNLSDFASAREHAKVRPELARLLDEVHAAGKPIGAICIAPTILAAWLRGKERPSLTIGDDADTAAALQAMGARHVACAADGLVVDERLKLVTTPAYMVARDVAEAGAGIERLVAEVLRLAGHRL